MNELEIVNIFKENSFRATPQRIAVYKYLCENPTHPDADEIYKSVIKMNPSFSKTTVYNSLQALEEQGLIIKINIDSDRVRYDAHKKLHGHFVCEKCNKIYDFDVEKIVCCGIDDFIISKKDVYYRGICPECK
ncbi:MAG: Fur family transcriptional regulator [Eubacterium sp.]